MKVLIFGAGGMYANDFTKWSDFFKSEESGKWRNCEWEVADMEVNHNVEPQIKKHKIDFNNISDLRSLPDTFDLILFDWSTAKFLQWNRNHITIVISKLKRRGKLMLPIERMMRPVIENCELLRATTISEYQDMLESLVAEIAHSIGKDDSKIMIGCNYAELPMPFIWINDYNRLQSVEHLKFNLADKRLYDDYQHPKNLSIISDVAGNGSCNLKRSGYLYPSNASGSAQMMKREFYEITRQ